MSHEVENWANSSNPNRCLTPHSQRRRSNHSSASEAVMRMLFLQYHILCVHIATIMRKNHTSLPENIVIHRMWCCQGFPVNCMLCQLIWDESLPLWRAPECVCSLYVPRLSLWTCGHDISCLASLSASRAILTDQWFFPHTPTKEVKWRGPLKSCF